MFILCLALWFKAGLQVKAIISVTISEIERIKSCLLSISLEKGGGRSQRKDSAQYLAGPGSSPQHGALPIKNEGFYIQGFIFSLRFTSTAFFPMQSSKDHSEKMFSTQKVNQASS